MKLKKMFQRKEKKYSLTSLQYERLILLLSEYMVEDQYGLHTICSLYYDTKHYELIRRSIEKPVYKEKFRIRSYGTPDDQQPVFLEIKKKTQGIVYKRRLDLPYKKALEYMDENSVPNFKNKIDQQISNEILWLKQRAALEPKVLIAYDRRALYSMTDEEFRVTFDFNIRFRESDLDMSHGDYGTLIAPEISVLMEVKALGAYPVWFSHLLADLQIYPSSFSKYAQVYQRYLFIKKEAEAKNVV